MVPFSKEASAMRDAYASARISKRLLLSYIFDWIMIIAVALIGYGFYKAPPNRYPFSLTDASISLPYQEHETVSTAVLVVAALVAPAVLIVAIILLFVPDFPSTAPGTGEETSRSQRLRLALRSKIWEWNAGWLGLGLSVAGAFMATQGLKAMYGRPRPDLLARCDPDLSRVAEFTVGGLGGRVDGAPTLLGWEICRNTGDELTVDGFASFPSGHASFAFAGLTYLSLWFCARFSIGFPYLAHSPLSSEIRAQKRDAIRSLGAAPPVYMVILAFVPFAVAFFIAASRWFDYRHHAFDIIIGSAMGVVFAWVSFRLYHLPVMRGAGWAWAARSRRHAFFKGVGVPSFVGANDWSVGGVDASADGLGGGDLESGPRDLAE